MAQKKAGLDVNRDMLTRRPSLSHTFMDFPAFLTSFNEIKQRLITVSGGRLTPETVENQMGIALERVTNSLVPTMTTSPNALSAGYTDYTKKPSVRSILIGRSSSTSRESDSHNNLCHERPKAKNSKRILEQIQSKSLDMTPDRFCASFIRSPERLKIEQQITQTLNRYRVPLKQLFHQYSETDISVVLGSDIPQKSSNFMVCLLSL